MSVLYGTDHFPTPTPPPLIWPKSPHLVINTLINNVINAGKNVPSKDCIFCGSWLSVSGHSGSETFDKPCFTAKKVPTLKSVLFYQSCNFTGTVAVSAQNPSQKIPSDSQQSKKWQISHIFCCWDKDKFSNTVKNGSIYDFLFYLVIYVICYAHH